MKKYIIALLLIAVSLTIQAAFAYAEQDKARISDNVSDNASRRREQYKKFKEQFADPEYVMMDQLEVRTISEAPVTSDKDVKRYKFDGVFYEQYSVTSAPVKFLIMKLPSSASADRVIKYRLHLKRLTYQAYRDVPNFDELRESLSYLKAHELDDPANFSDLYRYRNDLFEKVDKMLKFENNETVPKNFKQELQRIAFSQYQIEMALFCLDFELRVDEEGQEVYKVEFIHLFDVENIQKIEKLMFETLDAMHGRNEKRFYIVEMFSTRVQEIMPEVLEKIKEAN